MCHRLWLPLQRQHMSPMYNNAFVLYVLIGYYPTGSKLVSTMKTVYPNIHNTCLQGLFFVGSCLSTPPGQEDLEWARRCRRAWEDSMFEIQITLLGVTSCTCACSAGNRPTLPQENREGGREHRGRQAGRNQALLIGPACSLLALEAAAAAEGAPPCSAGACCMRLALQPQCFWRQHACQLRRCPCTSPA